jgi:hypothetical protein
MKAKKSNPFEFLFHNFVADFGGEVLEEANDGATADYYFREHNIIAELKTLIADSTEDMDRKLALIVDEYVRADGPLPPGFVAGDRVIVEMPCEIREKWLRPLRSRVDRLVGEANSQIRETRERLRVPSAKGMILISNVSNQYHDQPDFFRRLLAETLQKKNSPDGGLQYPEINGAVYLSFGQVTSRDVGMYFWANLQMQKPGEDVSPFAQFQQMLREGWCQYLRKVGVPIRYHGSQENPPREVFAELRPLAKE